MPVFGRSLAVWVVVVAMAATVSLGLYAAEHLGMDTDESKLIASDLPFRQREDVFYRAFPQTGDTLAIVIDAATSEQADKAAEDLTAALAKRGDLFLRVQPPGGTEFFRREGALFLPQGEVADLADHLIQAQPMIASLAADPSPRGLLGAIDQALTGIAHGEAGLDALRRPLALIAASVEAALAGRFQPLSWQSMLTGRDVKPEELRRFIITQPILDYQALSPGHRATTAVRQEVRRLGLEPANGVRVRLTGSVALTDDEFASVTEGAEISLLLSVVLVCVILMAALRSKRLVAAILVTLACGLVATAAFAAAAVGSLNPISVAFAVMFVGIAVDFGIQVCVRFRQERFLIDDTALALRSCLAGIAKPLSIAAVTSAVGFLSFVPTAYVGVSQLGLIAGAGMVIALVLNLTLLPALLVLLKSPPVREPVGFVGLGRLDPILLAKRGPILVGALVAAVAAALVLPRLAFDFNPLHLKDPKAESVATLFDLMTDPTITPYTIQVLAPSTEVAMAMLARLDQLPEVDHTISIASFVPESQTEKLAILADARLLLAPSLDPPALAPPPDAEAMRAAFRKTAAKLRETAAADRDVRRLAVALDAAARRGPEVLANLSASLTGDLPRLLDSLRGMLDARPVALADLPPDLREDWIGKDGQLRIEAYPKGDERDNAAMERFIASVRAIAPDATGTPVTIYESGRVVLTAFKQAGTIAMVAITLLLAVLLRRVRDVALVIAPLLLAGLLTLACCVPLGLSINFANIIGLPLLLGVGVAFNIYFVVNWRAGIGQPLGSSTARAVVFSALTTGSAFVSLAISPHLGTASMGLLLAMALAFTLATALLVLPAMLGAVKSPPEDLPPRCRPVPPTPARRPKPVPAVEER